MPRRAFGKLKPRPRTNGQISWQASFICPVTKKRRSKAFRQKLDARRWLDQIEAEIKAGTYVPKEVARAKAEAEALEASKRITIAEYAQKWLENVRATRSPNTTRSYLSTCRRYIVPCLGQVILQDLTEDACRDWYQGLPADKPGSRKNAYRTLLAMLHAAKDEKLIDSVPLAIKGALSKKIVRDEDRERVATPEQVRKIAASMPADLAVSVLIAGFMGLRYSEIAALRRKHIDLKEGLLKIRAGVKRTETGELVEGPPKTARSVRNVPISEEMAKALKTHLDKHVPPGEESLLVYSRSSYTRFLSNKTLHTYYDRAVKEVGLPGFGFHQLRATCATLLMRTGATPAEIQAILGHSDWATSQLYQRAPKERLKAAMNNLTTWTEETQ